jgi:hypothetical protein
MAQNIKLNPAQVVSAEKATELIGYDEPAVISEGYGNSVRLTYIDPTESLRVTLNEDGTFFSLDLWDTEGESPLEGSYDSDWMDVTEGEFGEELKELING